MKLVLFAIAACAFFWVLMVALNPWALHIGGRSTPLLYWHGSGILHSKDGKTYPLYVSWWPGKPGRHGGGRREGKIWSADLKGTGWLCLAPESVERMDLSGTMYGGYLTSDQSLFDFRFLEWQKPFQINYHNRGFFDVAGAWHGPELVLDRPNEQGIKLNTGPLIDNATVTLHWASYDEFETACRSEGSAAQ
ncbi:MAG TPA: hypothetical protein VK574_17340 [Terracidiphilus sp.]|nr:hypothetical protein [Terracidiphilus sp.]